ncbi:MAG: hypothetical protein EOO25_09295 [Comamonadaceae bacterium]|nr:MAG: hypothetical protein EOO25_09295 [Comamonadaceae bacterium]
MARQPFGTVDNGGGRRCPRVPGARSPGRPGCPGGGPGGRSGRPAPASGRGADPGGQPRCAQRGAADRSLTWLSWPSISATPA